MTEPDTANRPSDRPVSRRASPQSVHVSNERAPRRAPARNTLTGQQVSHRTASPNELHGTGRRENNRESLDTTCYQFPDSMLPSVFGDGSADVQMLRNIIRDIRAVQHRTNGRHWFHFLVETDQGQLTSSSSERFDHVITRVLFSPSISLDLRNEDSQMQSFFRELNGISWRAGTAQSTRPVSTSMRRNSNTGAARSRVGFNPDTGVLHLNRGENPNPTGVNGNHISVEVDDHPQDDTGNADHYNAPFHSDLFISIDRRPLPDSAVANWYASHRSEVHFPYWFPFCEKEYPSGPQVSAQALYVKKEAIENFEVLQSKQIQWIYRELFEFLFREAKRKKRRGIPSVFKYACFTPPWLRSQIFKGKEGDYANQTSTYFSNVVIPDMRNQRSRMGATRLAYILGAFLENESAMARKARIHLLRTVPDNPTLQKGRSPSRIGYMLPLSRTDLRTSTLERSSQQRDRSNERREPSLTRNEDRNYVSDRGNISARDHLPTPTQRERRCRRNMNVPSTTNERPSAVSRRVVRRSQDDPIVVDGSHAEQGSNTRNVRRRIEFETPGNSNNRQVGTVVRIPNSETPNERAMRARTRAGRKIPRMYKFVEVVLEIVLPQIQYQAHAALQLLVADALKNVLDNKLGLRFDKLIIATFLQRNT